MSIEANRQIVYLQDNLFIGFVEQAGADEIKGSARDAGFKVEDFGSYFNVVYNNGSISK